MSSRSLTLVSTSPPIDGPGHLLAILIRASELTSRFAFDQITLSPDLIDFLSRIAGSYRLPSGTRSSTISAATLELFNRAFVLSFPRVRIRDLELRRRDLADLRVMYMRKRKVRPSDVGLVGPSVKRRLFVTSESDELGNQNSSSKALEVHSNEADIASKELLEIGISSNIFSQGIALSAPNNYGGLLSISEVGIDEHLRGEEPEKECGNRFAIDLNQELCGYTQATVEQKESYDNTQAIIVHNELQELFGYDGPLDLNQNPIISEAVEAVTAGRPTMSEPDLGPILLDDAENNKPLLWMETLGEDSCITVAAPLAVKYEVNSSSNFLGIDNDSNSPSLEIVGHVGSQASHKENKVATGADYCGNKGGPQFKTSAFRKEPEESALKVQAVSKLEPLAKSLLADHKQQRPTLEKPKVIHESATDVGLQSSFREPNTKGDVNSSKQKQAKRDEKVTLVQKNVKKVRTQNIPSKENRVESTLKVPKSNSEPKILPNFDSFVIEEEEGSGGYGTVYRARRKEDGKIFAVKCPHPNSHSHHVNNEMTMLERFGGRNFVIKYEGSFKSGQSECFVLEHVEHDRPELLKRDIDVFQLQWYGYCMFRALASLHKQGVVHRDIKPGNFLFSRKLNKGYLIDFNLASDLHQKLSRSSEFPYTLDLFKKSGNTSNANLDPHTFSTSKSALYNQALKDRKGGILNNISKEVTNASQKFQLTEMKNNNKGQIGTFPKIESCNKYGSQAADSGVTSAKDPTSTRTSADRLKQLLPCKGRKELINFVHEAMQSPNPNSTTTGPSSQRKRVAAPLGKMNSKLMMPTPMPVHSAGHSIAGAGMLNRGNGKQNREGPCVGTKGFRAPEVLFKSYHQGCKVDVWSAGVTLLYLIIGKAPFGGDPEQNIKDISKLRGSEDLWEVAKLHSCESSFPPDLFEVKSLRSMELRDWCMLNTKRPEFLEMIPQSLFDLIDKCLIVNPRRRLTAEEALMHKFFAPCHESLKKQRLLRRTAGPESGSHSQSSY